MCVFVCVGRPKRHCAAATTGPPSPPTRHNKGQLNAAALPAEEPTASHTSTNRQICIKPKGRSNKSQPTGSDPPPISFRWFKPEGGLLHPITHYHCSGCFTIIRMCCLTCKTHHGSQWRITWLARKTNHVRYEIVQQVETILKSH